jgi:hypothetical protein
MCFGVEAADAGRVGAVDVFAAGEAERWSDGREEREKEGRSLQFGGTEPIVVHNFPR